MMTDFERVKTAVDALLSKTEHFPVVVAVDGMCGAGKTTLGERLGQHYGCNVFHMDDFFLRPEQRVPDRLATPGGNVDYERFQTQVLDHLADPEGVSYQRFDCGKMQLGAMRTLPATRLNIVEGSYSHHPYFGDIYDMRVFLEVSRQEQRRRILARSNPERLAVFESRWIPMENAYFSAFAIRERSSLVLTNEGQML